VLVAIAQLLFAISTIYRARGNQIDQFGFAAFGLTVIQYALMSFINLLGNLMCPQYPTLYVVQSLTMLEAQKKGAVIEGIVAILDEPIPTGDEEIVDISAEPDPVVMVRVVNGIMDTGDLLRGAFSRMTHGFRKIIPRLWLIALSWIPLAVTLGIIGGWTHFRPGNSTRYERVLTMVWLALGNLTGFAAVTETRSETYKTRNIYRSLVSDAFVMLLVGAPVVAAFWVVAKEILQYGNCTRIQLCPD
jgi:hypothetical protein